MSHPPEQRNLTVTGELRELPHDFEKSFLNYVGKVDA
jgi:hypothetical protein